ncbi:MAG: aldo/keto reductase, partial [Pseudomonas sp.]
MRRQSDIPDTQRRQMLLGAAVAGLAPLLLSACGNTSSDRQAGSQGTAPATPANTGSTAPVARRRLGPIEVFPIGLGVQWNPGQGTDVVNDLYSSSTDRAAGIALIRRAVDLGVT